MKRVVRKAISVLLTVAMLLSCSALAFTAFAWNAAPATAIDISPKLVGMMNVKIYQDEPYIANVKTVSSGDLGASDSPPTLYAYKFSSTGNSIGKNWPHQMGDGAYTEEQFQSYFGVDCINECMQINEEEAAVYMLYDLGDPDSTVVKKNMALLGITDINEYYKLMANNGKISIGALPGGGTAHETAITAYYRYSDDWRSYATAHSGGNGTRADLLNLGIAAPNENRYFFETQESQKRIDGGDAFPGVMDESVQQYIDHKESYSLPVWEDENENASWNIINPVPTCNIYSRWGTDFDKDTKYEDILAIKNDICGETYGDTSTSGQWYAYTGDQTRYYDGLDIDDMIVPKNWEWVSMPYYSTKSVSNGVATYSETTAYKSHLGYGEYCPAGVTTYHDFYLPSNQVEGTTPGRFFTVMIRETGTMCGLDGAGHWHSVQVNGVTTTNVVRFEPEINDDSMVVDYGLATEFSIDANDWVWTTDATNAAALPSIKDIKITNGNPDNESGYTHNAVNGKYGTLELVDWSNEWGSGHCKVKYTPKCIVNDVDEFYYKVYPNDSDLYQPMYAKITIVPASVVYYEDNFSASDSADSNFESSLQYSGSWTSVDASGGETQAVAVSGTQQAENVNYGYDLYYANKYGYSAGSSHKSSKGDSLTFTFKGTGCDIVMRTDAADGSVKYTATKSPILSDGSKSSESTTVTSLHSVSCRNDTQSTLYQLPVVSLRYDELAYYTVTVTAASTKSVFIDGVRVYNPLGVYGSDSAQNKTIDTYYNTYDKLAVTAPVYDILYNSNDMEGEVGFLGLYDNWNEWYEGSKNMDGDPTDFDSHLTIGPNNEVYLGAGQSLVFDITNANASNTLFAIEAKSLGSAATLMNVSVNGSKVGAQGINVNSNTAMYYEYDLQNSGIGESGTIRIENGGPNVLALTNLKYSKVMTLSGSIYYRFVDESGLAVPGVKVVVRNAKGETVASGFTGASGEFTCEDLSLGTYKAYITTPKGKSAVKTRTISVSESSYGDIQEFTLRDLDLDIGSAPEIWWSPMVELSGSNAVFTNYKTYTDPGSYTIAYNFSGSKNSSGYYSDKYYLSGNLVVIANTDGTVSYTFSGSGKADRNTISSKSGKVSSSYVSITDDELTVNYAGIINQIFGSSVISNASSMIPSGTFTLQAYELPDASIAGEYGDPATATLGDAGHSISMETATVSYTFKDEDNNPVAGVVVTVDGKSATSDENGFVTIDDIALGSQTVTFTTPAGKSGVTSETHSFSPVNKTYSHTYILRDMDLTIGSHPSNDYYPYISSVSTTTVTMDCTRPHTDAGSYKVTYVFDGSTTGKASNDKYFKGTLDVIVNSDGTGTYSYNGSYMDGKNTKSGTYTGSTASGVVSFSTNGISINYSSILFAISNKNDYVGKVTNMMPSGSSFSVTAYEGKNATGDSGDTATLTIGTSRQEKPKHPGSVTFTFFDDNWDPVPGVVISVDGKTATSGSNGIASITNITGGASYNVKVTTPDGWSTVSSQPITVNDTYYDFEMQFQIHEYTRGSVAYTFVDEDGDPVQGVVVSVDGKTATSGADGIASISGIAGNSTHTVSFTTPTGYSNISNRTITVSDSNHEFEDTFTLGEIRYGNAQFTFVDNKGNKVSGVQVSLAGSTATSNANGVASFTGIEEGSYTAAFTVPTGYKAAASQSVTIDADTPYTTTVTLEKNSFTGTPTITMGSPQSYHIQIGNYGTQETAQSYELTFNLDGKNTGYLSDSNYLNGTVSIFVNANDKYSFKYVFNGTGKGSGSTVSSKTDTVSFNAGGYIPISYTYSGYITMDIADLLYYVANESNTFYNASASDLFANGMEFTVKAYSGTLGSGDCIAEETIVLGGNANTQSISSVEITENEEVPVQPEAEAPNSIIDFIMSIINSITAIFSKIFNF